MYSVMVLKAKRGSWISPTPLCHRVWGHDPKSTKELPVSDVDTPSHCVTVLKHFWLLQKVWTTKNKCNITIISNLCESDFRCCEI